MRWGFIGCGRIAQRIMESFRLRPECEVVGVWSRNAESAQAFCAQWGIPRAYESLDALLGDPSVEIAYVATPHIAHLEHASLALLAGKHVLCEKPMCMSREETLRLTALAREKGLFLMEGLWTCFFPLYAWLRDYLADGALGRVYNVMADFSYHAPYDASLRFFRKELGGGAMRGAGIYPLALSCAVFGEMPTQTSAMADMASGVDLRSAALLRFPSGGTAQIYTGFQGLSAQALSIACEKGSVVVPDFWHPDRAELRVGDRRSIVEKPYVFPGFQYELDEVESRISQGCTESPTVPLAFSVGLSEIMDEMYAQFGANE